MGDVVFGAEVGRLLAGEIGSVIGDDSVGESRSGILCSIIGT